MKGQTPNRRAVENSKSEQTKETQPDKTSGQISTNQGYTEFFSWGNDEMGQLGHGQEGPDRKLMFNLPKSLSFEVLISQVSCGFQHTSFISKQGYVFSFGCNSDGQLGVNDQAIKNSTAPLLVSDLVSLQVTPTHISCGGFHTAVLTNSGDVYLWGRNLQGQCGRSINYNQFLFGPHKLHLESGNKQFRVVECGDQHTAVITQIGELYTFGDNSEGQLGVGIEFKNNIDRPALITSISEEVYQVSCGYRHTLVLTTSGTVLGMGTNKRYELASGTLQKSSQPIRIQTIDMFQIQKVIAGGFSVAITTQNELLVWGSGDFGVFQSPQKIYIENVQFTDVSLSKSYDSFGAAIDIDGFVYSWGQNQFGQLGQGDFRLRKLPTKVNQLRKKKVRRIVAGGGFIVALGKDVPEGTQKHKHRKPKAESKETELSARAKSQVTFGTNSLAQQSVKRRAQKDIDKSPMTESNLRSFGASQSREGGAPIHDGKPSPLRFKNQNTYQTPNIRSQGPSMNEVSIERQRRQQAERELREKEFELVNQKQQANQVQDLHSQILMYQRDNEVLREALQKEQENSYRLLQDVHKTLSDVKAIKDALDNKNRESTQLQVEGKRHIEVIKELQAENDKLRKDNQYVAQRGEDEVYKLKNHIAESEVIIDQQRQHIQDIERQLVTKMDQQKIVDSHAEQSRKENQDLRLQVLALNEKIKTLEYQLDSTQKQNDDLRYDNTILYEKNIQKDEKIIQLNDELLKVRDITQHEANQKSQIESDNKYLKRRVDEIENQLQGEKQAAAIRQKQNDELIKELDREKKYLQEELALKSIDCDNQRRNLDELQYDLENQRRVMNVKQDEVGSLNKIISQQSLNNNELVNTIKDLEQNIKDVEDKNKRLVELLNAGMYNKAEQYKERVLNKLQERNPVHGITPQKLDMHSSDPTRPQPSPVRLQKVINEDKDSLLRDRERLLRMADELTKSAGQPQSQIIGNYRPNITSFVTPFSNQNESSASPNKSVHFADQSKRQLNDPTSKLRMSDLSGGLVNMATPHDGNMTSFSRDNDTSPDRINELLRQQSPLRQKLPVASSGYGYSNDNTPNKNVLNTLNDTNFGPTETEQNLSTGNFTASKMTSKLLSSQLQELKQKMAAQQQDKLDLERRLQEYQSNQLRRQHLQ